MSYQDQSPQPSSDSTPELTALTKKSWFKKGIIFLGTLFVLLVATAVIVPLVVKVDRFRPEITAKINERLNGTAELGPLSLSLWGQIKVKIDSFKLMDAQKRPVVTVGEAYFHVPFSSIFSQAPLITLTMNRPEISVMSTTTLTIYESLWTMSNRTHSGIFSMRSLIFSARSPVTLLLSTRYLRFFSCCDLLSRRRIVPFLRVTSCPILM
jgi:hypothetical protein